MALAIPGTKTKLSNGAACLLHGCVTVLFVVFVPLTTTNKNKRFVDCSNVGTSEVDGWSLWYALL